ncbi:MAG: MATE family efflux transporter, partial [Peptoniphilaceae bacterium]|nr:MATE family efflux transporter [Peptoniphilaceae bacterium]
HAIVEALSAGFQVSLVAALVYALGFFAGLGAFVDFFALGPEISAMARVYGRIVLVGMIFKMLHFSYAQAFQSFGDADTPFRINLIGLLLNMVLDPLFIFGWGPMPALGIAGAAMATSLAQVVVYVVFRVAARQNAVEMDGERPGTYLIAQLRFSKPASLGLCGEIFRLGLPVALLSVAFCLISIVLNRMVSTFGALAVAVMTVGSQIESVNWMSTEGFGGALTAMTAQNIGAAEADPRRVPRVLSLMNVGMKTITSIGVVVMLAFWLFGRVVFAAFLPGNPAGIALGAAYLYIFSISEPFMAMETAAGACFNAFGRTVPPAAISIGFNLLRIPLGYLLMSQIGVYGVWAAMSFSSVLKGSLLTLWGYRLARRYGHPEREVQVGLDV